MIAKTYLISQATYLMGAIPIGDEMLNRMNKIIIDFEYHQDTDISAP